jgi:multidrug efflux pump subunit AcrA (membrane-fusion protein)
MRHRPFAATLILALLLAQWAPAGASAQRGPAPIEVAPVVEANVAPTQSFVGAVRPLRTSMVGSAVAGRVIEFPVNEGDEVEQGETLAQLLTDTLQLELEAARNELVLRQEELTELQNGARPGEIVQSQASVDAAKAGLTYAEARFRRADALFRGQSRAMTEDEYFLTRADHEKAIEALKEVQASHDLVVEGPRPEHIAQSAARVAIQEQIVKQFEDRISKHTIKAPFRGVVLAERTEVGQWISQGELVAEIAQLDTVEVEVYLPEDFIRFARLDTDVKVGIDALQREFTGTVTRIVPRADPRSRTFPVKILVSNEAVDGQRPIKAGMLARAELAVGPARLGMFVPKDALVLGGPTPVVWVLDADTQNPGQSVARSTAVRHGIASGGLIQVEGDLKVGMQVIVRGNERLIEGQSVRVVSRESSGAQPSIAASEAE